MSDGPRGLPLLSGPAPTLSENSSSQSSESCRKCGKEFNMLFLRSRKCNHCGYLYCHNCSDYQALMPRQGALEYTGYDATNVCGYCIEYLTITAGGRNHLKSLPIGKLRKYANAYNIKIDRAVEKDDIIEALMTARTQHGCLPPANENFYRTYSVPAAEHRSGLRNIFRSNQAETPANPPPPPPPRTPQSTFARPDIAPDPPSQSTRPPPPPPSSSTRPYQPYTQQRQPRPYQAQYGPPPRPPPRPTTHAPQQQQQYHTPPSQQEQTYYGGQPNRGYNTYGSPPPPPPRGPYHSSPPAPPPVFGSSNSSGGSNGARRRPAPQQQQSSAPTPTPTLAALLTMSPSSIKSLSIGTLKSILFTNHVNASHVLEKEELVNKVMVLVEEEKSERERQRRVEEMEEMERVQRERGVDADVDVDSSDDDDDDQEEEDHRHGLEEGGRGVEDVNEHDGETRTAAEARQAQQATPRIHIVNLGPSESDNEDEDTQQHQRPRSNSANISASPTDPPVTIPDTNTPTDDSDRHKSAPKKVHKHKLSPPKPSLQERSGLCVVCQDEEANIAIVDCGHLAMCRACSELIMESSRECPLCRTRIVTEARLLRIFKT